MNLLTLGRHEQPKRGELLHYKACGLDNVYLLNGFKTEVVDGEEYLIIEDLNGLWKAIGLHLVTTRKELEPKEMRFLRHRMNLTQAELAGQMRVTEQTIMRWEKGLTEALGPADFMLRVLFLGSKIAQPEGIEILREIAKLCAELFERDDPKVKASVFEHGRKKWKESPHQLELV